MAVADDGDHRQASLPAATAAPWTKSGSVGIATGAAQKQEILSAAVASAAAVRLNLLSFYNSV